MAITLSKNFKFFKKSGFSSISLLSTRYSLLFLPMGGTACLPKLTSVGRDFPPEADPPNKNIKVAGYAIFAAGEAPKAIIASK